MNIQNIHHTVMQVAIAKDMPIELAARGEDTTQSAQVSLQLVADAEPETEEDKEPQRQSAFASASELMELKAGQLRALARKHALPTSNGTKLDQAQLLEKHVTLRELNQMHSQAAAA